MPGKPKFEYIQSFMHTNFWGAQSRDRNLEAANEQKVDKFKAVHLGKHQ